MALKRTTTPVKAAKPDRYPADPAGIPRDQWGRPMIAQPYGGATAYTRASTLGDTLSDQHGLNCWQLRQVVLGMGRSLALRMETAVQAMTAPEDTAALDALVKQALLLAGADEASRIGTAIHAVAGRNALGEPVLETEADDTLAAHQHVISHFIVHANELFVVNDSLCAAGTLDWLVSPKGEMTALDGTVFGPGDRLIIDTKTAGTAKYFGLEFVAQLTTYATGQPYVRCEDETTGLDQLNSGVDVTSFEARCARECGTRYDWPDGIAPSEEWGLILHTPQGGSTAQLYWVALRQGEEVAELAVDIRERRKDKSLIGPAELPRVPANDPNGDLLSLISQAADEGAMVRLWHEHGNTWTSEHTVAVKERLAVISDEERAALIRGEAVVNSSLAEMTP